MEGGGEGGEGRGTRCFDGRVIPSLIPNYSIIGRYIGDLEMWVVDGERVEASAHRHGDRKKNRMSDRV